MIRNSFHSMDEGFKWDRISSVDGVQSLIFGLHEPCVDKQPTRCCAPVTDSGD